MKPVLAVATLIVAVMIGTTGLSQEKGEKPSKIKGYLPPGWKALNLDADQKAKIGKIHNTYKDKTHDLEEQIKALKVEEKKEMAKVLTDAQRKQLASIIIPDEAVKETPAKDGVKKDKQ
jgi:hypothetical protein